MHSLRFRDVTISWLDHTPHASAVYASCSALLPPHATLASQAACYGLTWAGLAPADRASFGWRLRRGRDASYLAPPAQIRTCSFPAYGSHLGCVTAKRSLGQGWRMIGFGRKSSANFVIRAHVIRSFWLRRRSVRR